MSENPKIKLEWTTTVTEDYEVVMTYEEFTDFLSMRREAEDGIPTLEDIAAGTAWVNWGDLGAEFEEDATQMSASVDDRELTIFIVKE